MIGTVCHCQQCRQYLGPSPGTLQWVGVVKRCPAPDGKEYKPCKKCGVWNVFEVVREKAA